MEPVTSDDSEKYYSHYKSYSSSTNISNKAELSTSNNNIIQKLFNRELFGSTSRKCDVRRRKFFERIPSRLRFCLKDIVPHRYLRNHVFMGFSQCGQFLLSFTLDGRTRGYSESYKYTLNFLSWVPGRVAELVHSVPLFGDDYVDSNVTVSMAQWKHNISVIVVYGIAKHDKCLNISNLSIIGVPRLGCRRCSAMSKEDDGIGGTQRCLEHNFAIHSKFFCTSDSNMYEPVVQLAYSNQIIIYTDFIHILEIDLVKPDQDKSENVEDRSSVDKEEVNSVDLNPGTPASDFSAPFLSPKYQNNVVQNILADFSDLEVDQNQISRPVYMPDMMGQELCIQASSISHNLMEEWEGPSPSIRTLISPPLRSPRGMPAEGLSRFNESYRVMAEKTYEFVEETDTKCEKLSMFRKRRLADKKYEFSEDNNENIIPFRILRSNRKYFTGSTSRRRAKSPSVESVVLRAHNQISRPPSPMTSLDLKSSSSIESDRNSESEYRIVEMLDDGSLKTVSVHDNTSKTLSDCSVSPQDPYLVHSGNSKCSKFFTRYFVESDDEITSITTDSEDDCISGYHVALPLTGHGANYTPLQVISGVAWERLRASPSALPPLTLRAHQRSLDIELLCNEVCGRLCKLNGKKFIYCFDWGCHVIDVCDSSGCLSGLCAMWVWASEGEAGACEPCAAGLSGCVSHRRQYAAECLFVWDLETGVYRTEKVSMAEDNSQEGCRVSGAERARELAKRLGPINLPPHENRRLTTLTGKSLQKLTDIDNCIEITKHNEDSSESEDDVASDIDEDDED